MPKHFPKDKATASVLVQVIGTNIHDQPENVYSGLNPTLISHYSEIHGSSGHASLGSMMLLGGLNIKRRYFPSIEEHSIPPADVSEIQFSEQNIILVLAVLSVCLCLDIV
jgi:hypothetical protein